MDPITEAPPARGARLFEPRWSRGLPRRWYARHGQRWLDRALLCLVLPPALPLMLLLGCANAVAFRGLRRVFFLQPRIGRHGRPFRIYKFRTMAEVDTSDMGSWSSGADQLRVTRFGRFLRNTHLDELPQVLNVLRGEMSFIGPRPEMVEVEMWAAEEVPGFGERLVLRPGIAGLAQVTQGYAFQSVDDYREKLRLNREYIRHMSLGLDLQIVARTAWWMLRGKGWSWKGASTPATPEPVPQAELLPRAARASAVGETRAAAPERISAGR